jgi:serine/threonine protein kinase
VAYMHERHVMHRDLKLENILLNEHFNIKISDFGCCRHHVKPNFKRRTTFCGTMEYICPEMIKEEPYTNSVDVYCIGIILY